MDPRFREVLSLQNTTNNGCSISAPDHAWCIRQCIPRSERVDQVSELVCQGNEERQNLLLFQWRLLYWCHGIRPHLQALFIYAKPFYSPQECSSFILDGVYIPPRARVREALQRLANQITSVRQEHPDCILIIWGILTEQSSAMSCTNTGSVLSIPRGTETDCHTVLKDAYCSFPPVAFEPCDRSSSSISQKKSRDPEKARGKHGERIEQCADWARWYCNIVGCQCRWRKCLFAMSCLECGTETRFNRMESEMN